MMRAPNWGALLLGFANRALVRIFVDNGWVDGWVGPRIWAFHGGALEGGCFECVLLERGGWGVDVRCR